MTPRARRRAAGAARCAAGSSGSSASLGRRSARRPPGPARRSRCSAHPSRRRRSASAARRARPGRRPHIKPVSHIAGRLSAGMASTSRRLRLLDREALASLRRAAAGRSTSAAGFVLIRRLRSAVLAGLVEVVPVAVDRARRVAPWPPSPRTAPRVGPSTVRSTHCDPIDRRTLVPEELVGVGDRVRRLHPGVTGLARRRDVRAPICEPGCRSPRRTWPAAPAEDRDDRLRPQG